jgi:hypothetical protein
VQRSERAALHPNPATARGLLTLAGVLAVCLTAAPAAFADGGRVGDPRNDAKSSRLLGMASIGHGHSAQRLAHRLRSEPQPRPIAGQGYSRVFNQEFDALNRTVWANRQWWQRRPPANAIYVQDGILHVVSRRSQGYPNVTASSEPHRTGKGRSFRQGYFEARMRWTGALGSGPAFWLFSTAHATNRNWPRPACPKPTCLAAEIDVFEGYGHRLNVFTGTIHRNSDDLYGVSDEINRNNWRPQRRGTNLAADYHVYSVLWTETKVRWYLDGRLVMSWPVYDSTNQRMNLVFSNWRTPSEPENKVGPATPDELHTEVDWVRVWQK